MKYTFLIVDEKLSSDCLSDLVTELPPEGLVHNAHAVKAALPFIEKEKAGVLCFEIKMGALWQSVTKNSASQLKNQIN